MRNLKQFFIYLHLLIQLFKVWEPSTDLVTFVTQAYEGKSSMILTSYCPLSTFRCGSCTCFSLLLAAAHLWFTCIREVFKKNFTPVLYFVHLLRLLLVVDPPTGIFETWPISIRVNTSLSESSGSMKHRRTMAFCEFSGDQCLLFIREGTPGRQPHYGISEAGLRFTCVFYTSFCKCNSRFRQVQCHSNNEKKYC